MFSVSNGFIAWYCLGWVGTVSSSDGVSNQGDWYFSVASVLSQTGLWKPICNRPTWTPGHEYLIIYDTFAQSPPGLLAFFYLFFFFWGGGGSSNWVAIGDWASGYLGLWTVVLAPKWIGFAPSSPIMKGSSLILHCHTAYIRGHNNPWPGSSSCAQISVWITW